MISISSFVNQCWLVLGYCKSELAGSEVYPSIPKVLNFGNRAAGARLSYRAPTRTSSCFEFLWNQVTKFFSFLGTDITDLYFCRKIVAT